jgi:hypothetical protein
MKVIDVFLLPVFLIVLASCTMKIPAFKYDSAQAWMEYNIKSDDKMLIWYENNIQLTNSSYIYDTVSKQIKYDIAYALITDDHKNTLAIMNKYDANYLCVTQKDSYYASRIAKIAKLKANDNSILIRALRKGEIPGFLVAYMDENLSIYKIRES